MLTSNKFDLKHWHTKTHSSKHKFEYCHWSFPQSGLSRWTHIQVQLHICVCYCNLYMNVNIRICHNIHKDKGRLKSKLSAGLSSWTQLSHCDSVSKFLLREITKMYICLNSSSFDLIISFLNQSYWSCDLAGYPPWDNQDRIRWRFADILRNTTRGTKYSATFINKEWRYFRYFWYIYIWQDNLM